MSALDIAAETIAERNRTIADLRRELEQTKAELAKTLAALETISCARCDLRDHLVRIYAKTHEAAGAALPWLFILTR